MSSNSEARKRREERDFATITVTLSREDAEAWQAEAYSEAVLARMVAICSAALEGER